MKDEGKNSKSEKPGLKKKKETLAEKKKRIVHEQEQEQSQEEQKGIIPEGMDFRKFLGCGG